MKKLLYVLVLVAAVLLASLYILIPGKMTIAESVSIHSPLTSISRSFTKDSDWEKWWPGTKLFSFNDRTYTFQGNVYNVIPVVIADGEDSISSSMELAYIRNDSTLVIWKLTMNTALNPIKRLSRYRLIRAIRSDLKKILENMKDYMQDSKNIYGISVRVVKVVDSVLISTRRNFSYYPGIRETDSMIQQLKTYIAQQGASEKNYPMLNVHKISEDRYEAMVAIPVDRTLPETKDFSPKDLLKGGNILEAEVRGGPETIMTAFNELENYYFDYNYSSPAIPFQLMVTDRARETDTTKWVTRLYYPVL